jgi:hypothetical protein
MKSFQLRDRLANIYDVDVVHDDLNYDPPKPPVIAIVRYSSGKRGQTYIMSQLADLRSHGIRVSDDQMRLRDSLRVRELVSRVRVCCLLISTQLRQVHYDRQ